jgi:hypothetical protein
MSKIVEENLADTNAVTKSMSEILSETRSVYNGHPANSGNEDSVEDKDSSDLDKSDSDDSKSKTSSDKEKTSSGDDSDSDQKDSSDELKKDAEFKYKSHEEAEKGYREAEKLATRKAEEARLERERAETLAAQLSEMEAKLAEGLKKSAPKDKASSKDSSTLNKEMQGEFKKLYEDIAKLDPSSDDYEDKISERWAQLGEYQQAQFQKVFEKMFEEYKEEEISKKQAAEKQYAEDQALVKKVISDATEAGLNMKEGSYESELFWMFSKDAPEGTSVDEQIKWTCDRVKQTIEEIRKPIFNLADKANEAQDKNSVLERGGTRPPQTSKKRGGGEENKPMTLLDAFTKTERRI